MLKSQLWIVTSRAPSLQLLAQVEARTAKKAIKIVQARYAIWNPTVIQCLQARLAVSETEGLRDKSSLITTR